MKIGIDIGGSHISCGIVDKYGKIVAKESKDIDISNIKDEKEIKKYIIDVIDNEIKTLLNKENYTIGDITKIGVAVPGGVRNNTIIKLVNLHIENFDIANILKEKYDTIVKVKNDGKCAAIAEKKYGALKKYSDCVFLCIGTGLGGAVFLDGDLLETSYTGGFELGHIVIDKNAAQCNCGRRGCFETFASMKRFKLSVIEKFNLPEDIKSEEIQSYIRENIQKKQVKEFVEEYLQNIAIGLCNIMNIFQPEAICFGGSFSYYADIFLPILSEKIKEELNGKCDVKSTDEVNVKLLQAMLKNDAGIIGATEID